MHVFCISDFFLIFGVELLSHFEGTVAYFLEFLEFKVDVFLDFVSLGKEHFPFFDIIDRFIVMRDQVSFNQGAISHIELLSCTLGALVDVPVCKRWILTT